MSDKEFEIDDVFFLDSGISEDLKIMYVPQIARVDLVRNELNDSFSTLTLSELDELGLVHKPRKTSEKNESGIMIFPTTDCNMRCIYCYARAGEQHKNLDFSIAKKAIDYRLAEKKHRLRIMFHGGGEPLFNFSLVRNIMEYIDENDVNKYATISTNGVMSNQVREWALDNLDHISISFDGDEKIQNKQRPLANGKGSYKEVLKTIEALNENKRRFGTRTTITQDTVDSMDYIIEHFHTLDIKSVKMEPLFQTGRCDMNNLKPPDGKRFARKYMDALEVAERYAIDLKTTFFDPRSVKKKFCGAVGRNFGITPYGNITSCVESGECNDSAGKIFIYGKVTEDGVHIDEEKLSSLKKRTLDNLEHCTDCFTKYVCAGGCPVKAYRTSGEYMNVNRDYCDISRDIGLKYLQRVVKKEYDKKFIV